MTAIAALCSLAAAIAAVCSLPAASAATPPSESMPEARSSVQKPAVQTPAGNSRDLLRLYGIDESDWSAFSDGPPTDAEPEGILRVLYGIRRTAPGELDALRQPAGVWREWLQRGTGEQGAVIRLSGLVQGVATITPSDEMAARFEMPRYYRVRFLPNGVQPAVTVYTAAVPRRWTTSPPLDEPASVTAVFLKLDRVDDGEEHSMRHLVLAARRVEWHPRTLLGKLNMDVGLFDGITNGTPIGSHERECFYQLLAAAGRADPAELNRRTQKKYSVVPLFNDPNHQIGKLVALTATARRVLLVRVEDPDIVQRLGIDHYYEIDVFSVDSQNNPIMFCVRNLPRGFPQGEKVNEDVRIAGFYFKKWLYRASADDRAAGDRSVPRRLAPLLVAHSPQWLEQTRPESNASTAIIAGAFVAAVILFALVTWRVNRQDRKFVRQALQRGESPPAF